METIIVTAAYPFIPAELNMAHMASTYIPADAYSRFIKLLGYDCRFVSATDVHGISVQNLLKSKDKRKEEVIQQYHEYYQECFRLLNVKYDEYKRTDCRQVKDLVIESLYRLKETGYIIKKKSDNYLCKTCNEYLPRRYRTIGSGYTATHKMKINSKEEHLKCAFCGSEEIELQSIDHWFLSLKKGEALISQRIGRQKDIFVKNYLTSIVKQGLKEWDFTRENYFGLPIPFEREKYIYLWYESLVAYLILFDYMGGKFRIKHFMGKNIVYYHGIIWPLLLECGLLVKPLDMQICAKGFMDMNKSDQVLIDIKAAVNKYPKDYIRFYAIYRVPDSFQDFYFSEENFRKVTNSVLCQQIGGFLNRCRSILYKNQVMSVPEVEIKNYVLDNIFQELGGSVYDCSINDILEAVIRYVKSCGNVIEKYTIYRNPSVELLKLLCEMMVGALLMMAPFTPSLVEDYNIFEGLKLDKLENRHHIAGLKIIEKKHVWRQIDE